jgi:hypothetical protein
LGWRLRIFILKQKKVFNNKLLNIYEKLETLSIIVYKKKIQAALTTMKILQEKYFLTHLDFLQKKNIHFAHTAPYKIVQTTFI